MASSTLAPAGPRAVASRPSGGPLNGTVIRMTARGMLGKRRGALLFTLPVVLLVIAGIVRGVLGSDPRTTETLLSGFAMSVLVPLIGLVAGTGAIGPEIDDGSIVYLLSKPVRRSTVVLSKVLVAIGCTAAFGALPVALSALVLSGGAQGLPAAFGLGALVSGVVYAAVFVLLGIVSRHAVVIGLIYVLIWEGLLGGLVPGAQVLSIGQWGVSVAHEVAAAGAVSSSVSLVTASVLLAVVAVAATWLASARLARLRLTGEE